MRLLFATFEFFLICNLTPFRVMGGGCVVVV